MNKTLRIFLADDFTMMRDGLRTMLRSQSDLHFVGDDEDCWTTVSEAGKLNPDVAVLDVCAPGARGIEMTKRLKEVLPNANVLILSLHDDMDFLRETLRAGATGYVLRSSGDSELVRAIRAVAAGTTYIDAAMALRLVGATGRGKGAHDPLETAELSPREEEVVRLIARGYSNKEVASRMDVSVKTVETYRARSLRKLQIQSRAEIVRYALRKGWLTES